MSDDLLGWILGIATFLVIAGVALEGAEYVEEIREKGWQLANPWKFAQKSGFAILVIGLAGEWYSSTIVHGRDADRIISLTRESQQLQHDNLSLKEEAKAAEGKIAEDNKMANKAASDAAKLSINVGNLHDFVKRQIDQNNAAVVELKKNTADLEKARADAMAAATDAKEDIAKAEQALAQEEEIRNQIIALTAPRTVQQQDAFVRSLKPFAGVTANILLPPSTTPDSGPLATLLVTLLTKAGWKTGFLQALSGWSKAVLVCTGKDPKPNVAAAAKALVLALRAANILAFVNPELGPEVEASGQGSLRPSPDMTILVGSKQ